MGGIEHGTFDFFIATVFATATLPPSSILDHTVPSIFKENSLFTSRLVAGDGPLLDIIKKSPSQ